MAAQGALWSEFSFVVSSGVRERVIASLAGTPKVPKQLAVETGLRIYHVSRALRELSDRGLVECLTPANKGRGRLYALTDDGSGLLDYLAQSRRRFLPVPARAHAAPFVPKIRASTLLRFLAQLRASQGESAVREAVEGWGVNPSDLGDDTWLSVDAYARFLDLVEAKFGDGSYAFVRAQFAEAVASFPTVREQISLPIPLEALAERATIVYGKEWNFGRMEVQTSKRRAVFAHFDWMPTPAMCAMFHGVYEGVLKARNFPGKVTKTRCVRNGDDRCEYVVAW
ncbi:MAG TPA: MarR family winged helix-turn-helix transcriptional regulator [Thermoplasmata archaeon]|nr:MarR family winged helix-turn-helix transcriptional regulator [Thermoplasmata archaeon]